MAPLRASLILAAQGTIKYLLKIISMQPNNPSVPKQDIYYAMMRTS